MTHAMRLPWKLSALTKNALDLSLLATVISCIGPTENSQTSGVVSLENLWPDPSAIPVCWASSVDLDATLLAELKVEIRDLVTSQYARTSRVVCRLEELPSADHRRDSGDFARR